MNIFYQDKLLSHIDSFTLDTLPHTLLIQGDLGSGKHLIADYIVSKFEFPCIDITEQLNLDTIDEIYLSSQVRFFIIDTDNISVKEQNIILKFLEEPCATAYIILLNSNKKLLETIIGRCYKLVLHPYSKEQLKTFLIEGCSEEILNVAKTPGQIRCLIENDFIIMMEFADKIFNNIGTANFSNCLTIPNKLAFSKKDNGYPIDIFVLILIYKSASIYDVYMLTNKLYNNLCMPNVNKKYLFYNYLIDLKCIYNEKFRRVKV